MDITDHSSLALMGQLDYVLFLLQSPSPMTSVLAVVAGLLNGCIRPVRVSEKGVFRCVEGSVRGDLFHSVAFFISDSIRYSTPCLSSRSNRNRCAENKPDGRHPGDVTCLPKILGSRKPI